MRKIVTSLAVLAALTTLAACDQPDRPSPKGFQPTEQAAAPDAEVAMPDDAPPQEESDDALPGRSEAATGEPGSCLSQVGPAASARLVQRCIAVSPATRPPCNAANTCDTIQGEIDRSCAMYGPGETKPAECAA